MNALIYVYYWLNVQKMKLLDRVAAKLRVLQYSRKTEINYVSWVKRYILYHNKKHPENMGKIEIEAFLSHLASQRNVAASTQNQAFNALLFLYHRVLEISLEGEQINALRAKQRVRIPVVLNTDEVNQIFDQMNDGIYLWILQTIYGCGLRLSEVHKLRVKDIDFAYNRIIIWDSKSLSDRTVPLPIKLIPVYQKLIKTNRIQHQQDLAKGFGSVDMPTALSRKYPRAQTEFKWQFLFTMSRLSKDPISGIS
ncbi:integron integrase [Marinicella sediminis]|uniref:Integron integrase n=1 Tax=Marinicella sediminis TaxID=1792834 RepID=A0ABV7JCT6_9GAMM|nr:integron integrase [Marinicella sediminis]